MEILVGRACAAIRVDGRACAAIRDSVRGPLRSFADFGKLCEMENLQLD